MQKRTLGNVRKMNPGLGLRQPERFQNDEPHTNPLQRERHTTEIEILSIGQIHDYQFPFSSHPITRVFVRRPAIDAGSAA